MPEYRRPLIAQEILGYNADVVCLQEVDEKAFAIFFQPVMSYAGAFVQTSKVWFACISLYICRSNSQAHVCKVIEDLCRACETNLQVWTGST